MSKIFSMSIALLALALFITACGNNSTRTEPVFIVPTIVAPAVPTLDAQQISLGKTVYDQNCAACHGLNGEGQPNWKVPNDDGSLPAPPHDVTGHTWHHADALLIDIITNGEKDIFPQSQMLAFGNNLSSEEIAAVVTYIKTWWGPEERAFQWQVTTQSED